MSHEDDESKTTQEGSGGSELLGEEASTAEYTPIVKLEEVHISSGEEDDIEIYKQRCALYRFASESKEWKERGRGDIKILKNKNTDIIRLLMRQDKTLKVCLNHVINPLIELQSNAGSDRSWVWRSTDYADVDEPKDETFAVRFQNSEIAQKFKDEFNTARETNKQPLNKSTSNATNANANTNAETSNLHDNHTNKSSSSSSTSAAGGASVDENKHDSTAPSPGTDKHASATKPSEHTNIAASAPANDRERTLDSDSTIAAPKGDRDLRSVQATETDKPGKEPPSSEEYATGRTTQSTATGATQDPSSHPLTQKAGTQTPSDALK